jgi:hypothetical protein
MTERHLKENAQLKTVANEFVHLVSQEFMLDEGCMRASGPFSSKFCFFLVRIPVPVHTVHTGASSPVCTTSRRITDP